MLKAKLSVLGLVFVVIIMGFSSIQGSGTATEMSLTGGSNGEYHYYMVLNYNGSGILRKYGSLALVYAPLSAVDGYEYFNEVDYIKNIGLAGIFADPLENPRIFSSGDVKGTSKYYIVQFNGPPTLDDLNSLKEYGDIVWYVPYNAYLVHLTSSPENLKNLKNVRWYGIYQPMLKLAPDLRELVLSNLGYKGGLSISPAADGNLLPVRVIMWNNELTTIRYVKDPKITRFGGLVYITGFVSPEDLEKIAYMDDVLYVEKYITPKIYDEKSVEIIGAPYPGDGAWIHNHLLNGEGVIVAVADTGMDTGSGGVLHPDLADRVIAFWSANGDDAHDGHGHGTHVAGIIAGTAATGERDEDGYLYGLGVAPHAHLVAEKIFGDDGSWLSPDHTTLAYFAYANGAVISSNSWGASVSGAYTSESQIYDVLTRDADPYKNGSQELLFVFAAGNSGPNAKTVGSPGTAKNVLTVGAVGNNRFGDNYESIASFSSRGPTEDGRLKPDVVAPGTWIASALSQDAHPGWAWGNIDRWYEWCGGTSQATPHVSGAAAVFVQYYRGIYGDTPSPALIKAALINSAIDVNGTDAEEPIPNNNEGWGMVYLPNIVDPPYGEIFIDENATLKTGDVYEYNLTVRDSTHPLKVTMVYTDREASPGANPTLVNDLNLVVYGPHGEVYVGNNFSGGWTQEGAGNGDARNNTENVYIQHPEIGNYTIRVVAQNVPMDAVPETPEVDQDFALVITGDVGKPPHYSAVRFSKDYYKPGDDVNISVMDSYANTNPAEQELVKCDVYVNSTGDHERVVLMEGTPDSGIFVASIHTEPGDANPGDGILQISTIDTLNAVYKDFLGSIRYAKTHVDGDFPGIQNISVDEVKSTSARVFIRTTESARIVVYYGTYGHLTNVSLDGYGTVHSVILSNLIPYTDYYFNVYVEDLAGNGIFDTNNGAHYHFRTLPPARILLVADDAGAYSYSTIFLAKELNDLGYDYDLWNTVNEGSPSLDLLLSHSVVIWNTGPDWSSETLTSEDQSNLKSYMDHGGRLILMGDDIIWGTGLVDLFTDYFHISSVNQDAIYGTKTTVYGVSGNPITGNYTSGLILNSTYTMYIDELTTDGSAEVSSLFRDTNSKDIGVMVDNATYRAIYLAFPYECLAVDEYGAALNITDSMIKWVLNGTDVFSLYLKYSDWAMLGENYSLRVLVSNFDNVSHSTNVTFIIDNSTETVYNYTRNVVVPSGGLWLRFNWTPDSEGIYRVVISVDRDYTETITVNNVASYTLYVRELLGTVRVGVLDSWVADYASYGDLDYISSHWYRYGNYKVIFDTQRLNKDTITLHDILSADPDVLMISNAWSRDYGWEFSDSEINSISVAVAMGYGIVATSGTFDASNAPNNMKLAPIFGLNESIGGIWADQITQFSLINESHPVFSGLQSPLPTQVGYACVGLVPDKAVVLAVSDNSSSYSKKANITEYKFGGGEALYLPTISEYNAAGDEDMHLLYNMLVYAWKNSTPIPHDLASIEVVTDRPWVHPGESLNVTVRIFNAGTYEDTGNVTLYAVYENGSQAMLGEKSVVAPSHRYINVTFNVAFASEGEVRLIAMVSSPMDMITMDNVSSGVVYVRMPRGTILVAGVDSLGSAYPSMMIWKDLKEHWYMYGNRTLEFDMGTLTGKNITYDDLVRSKADVLIISDAWNNYPSSGIWWEFSDSEIAAIKQYVAEGHGLIMTSGTLSVDNVPNNMKLASLAGLNESASMHWADTFSGKFVLNMSYSESTEIFRGIADPYVSGVTYTAYGWSLNSSSPADILANSTDNYAGVFFHKYSLGSVIYFSHIPEYAASANRDDRQLVYNSIVFTYLNSTQPVTDTSKPQVEFVSPTDGSVVSGILAVRVNATDNISWIPNVTVYLINSTINISFETVHDYSLGVFKAAIDTKLYSDGNYTLLAKAVDYYGNANWTHINITVDNTNPLVRITNIEDGAKITERDVTVEWTYYDPHMSHLEVEIDGGSWINVGMAENYTFHNLSIGEHTVVVRAYDILGHIGSYGVTFDVVKGPVPSAPQNLVAHPSTGTEIYINLTWETPQSTGGIPIVEYRIYRGTASGGEVLIANVSGDVHYFNDTSVRPGTTYYYYITAVNANGEGERSEEVSATVTQIPEMEILAVPLVAVILILFRKLPPLSRS